MNFSVCLCWVQIWAVEINLLDHICTPWLAAELTIRLNWVVLVAQRLCLLVFIYWFNTLASWIVKVVRVFIKFISYHWNHILAVALLPSFGNVVVCLVGLLKFVHDRRLSAFIGVYAVLLDDWVDCSGHWKWVLDARISERTINWVVLKHLESYLNIILHSLRVSWTVSVLLACQNSGKRNHGVWYRLAYVLAVNHLLLCHIESLLVLICLLYAFFKLNFIQG